MPTVLRKNGFRFFFSDEGNEPCHIHVEGRDGIAKFWLPSCVLATSANLNSTELKQIYAIIIEHRAEFEEAWNEHFTR